MLKFQKRKLMPEETAFLFIMLLVTATMGVCAAPSPATAGEIIVHVGPPSVGQGGSNPLSVPPINPIEYEFEWISPRGFEANIGITPGLLFGARSQTAGGLYVGAGGGLVISANGVGPGVYSSFGLNLGKKVFFNAELKQAIGIALETSSIISPYALRVGMGFRW
jgi:hypothetical protein